MPFPQFYFQSGYVEGRFSQTNGLRRCRMRMTGIIAYYFPISLKEIVQ